jgi:hypothetical protein
MGISRSISFLALPRVFCQLVYLCIHTLSWGRVYRSLFINAVSTYVYNPQQRHVILLVLLFYKFAVCFIIM